MARNMNKRFFAEFLYVLARWQILASLSSSSLTFTIQESEPTWRRRLRGWHNLHDIEIQLENNRNTFWSSIVIVKGEETHKTMLEEGGEKPFTGICEQMVRKQLFCLFHYSHDVDCCPQFLQIKISQISNTRLLKLDFAGGPPRHHNDRRQWERRKAGKVDYRKIWCTWCLRLKKTSCCSFFHKNIVLSNFASKDIFKYSDKKKWVTNHPNTILHTSIVSWSWHSLIRRKYYISVFLYCWIV